MSYPKWQRITSQPDGLGESPFWHPAEKCLYWVDIPGQRLRRMAMTADALEEQKPEDWPLGEEPGCFAPAAQGGWVRPQAVIGGCALRHSPNAIQRWQV
ncbi:MAG: L-arabinolactonase [Pseudomonadota bacterium]